MIILEGRLLGRCPNHDHVVGDGLDLDFPDGAYCGGCGEELDELIELEETLVIHANEVVRDSN